MSNYKSTLFLVFLMLLSILTSAQDKTKYEKGYAAYEAGDYKTALDYLNKALKEDPTLADAYFYKGKIYFAVLIREIGGNNHYTTKNEHQKLYDLITSNFKDAIKYNPKDCYAYKEMGLVENMFQELEVAANYYEKVIDCTDDAVLKSICYNSLGLTQFYLKKMDKAVLCYEKALELIPDNVDAKINLGTLSMATGNYEKALMLYEDILDKSTSHPDLKINYAFLHIELKKYEKAVMLYDEIIENTPERGLAVSLNNRGFAKLQLGKVNQALKDINHSLELHPTNSYAVKNKGLVYIAKKEPEEACKYFKKAEDLGYGKLYGDEVAELIKKHCE